MPQMVMSGRKTTIITAEKLKPMSGQRLIEPISATPPEKLHTINPKNTKSSNQVLAANAVDCDVIFCELAAKIKKAAG